MVASVITNPKTNIYLDLLLSLKKKVSTDSLNLSFVLDFPLPSHVLFGGAHFAARSHPAIISSRLQNSRFSSKVIEHSRIRGAKR